MKIDTKLCASAGDTDLFLAEFELALSQLSNSLLQYKWESDFSHVSDPVPKGECFQAFFGRFQWFFFSFLKVRFPIG